MKCSKATIVASLALLLATSGCGHWRRARALYQAPAPQSPLGATSDQIWQNQETNAEASDFVVHQHEFKLNTLELNTAGKDHVKEIAFRLQKGHDFPVVVERSMTSRRADTEFHYPVHPNPELDMRRREVIVRSLAVLGVNDADGRVVVAPDYVPGFKSFEAEDAYQRGMTETNGVGFGFGVGGFGGGGFGGF